MGAEATYHDTITVSRTASQPSDAATQAEKDDIGVKANRSLSVSTSNSEVDAQPPSNMTPLEAVTSKVDNYPQGLKLVMALLSIYLSVFLVALDRTIIATALPQITNQFQSFADIGWYNAAFLLPTTAFQLFFGRMYTFYSPKWIFMTLIFIFEVGSAICGAAPNSVAFIWGRAVAGLGAGGLFNGGMVLMMYAAPLEKRPLYMGFLGAVFGVASVAGPLLGGVFTTKVTWRWCFYINLPFGAIILAFLYFVLEDTPPALGNLAFKEKISRIDIPGTLVFLPCVVCLILALQWGGQKYDWSDARIIVLLVLFGVLLVVFIGIQIWRQDAGTVPPRIAKQRTIAAGTCYSFCLGSSFMVMVYYLSLWFQAIKGDTAIESGYSTLPFILSLVIASILSGAFVARIGYYNPSILTSVVLASVGAGGITLFKPTTNHSMWIGLQVLYGFGIGLGLQQSNIAAQAVLPKEDASTGMSLVFFGQGIGGTISVAIAQNVLGNKLIAGLSTVAVNDGIDPKQIVNIGATELKSVFTAAQLPDVLRVYNSAIVTVFQIGLVFACLSVLGASAMEWKSLKKNAKKPVPAKSKDASSSPDSDVEKVDHNPPAKTEV